MPDLIEGRSSLQAGRTELVRLATRLIIEEGLEAEVREALGRENYERGGVPGGGSRIGVREGRLNSAEGFIGSAAPPVAGGAGPFRSEPLHACHDRRRTRESTWICGPCREKAPVRPLQYEAREYVRRVSAGVDPDPVIANFGLLPE